MGQPATSQLQQMRNGVVLRQKGSTRQNDQEQDQPQIQPRAESDELPLLQRHDPVQHGDGMMDVQTDEGNSSTVVATLGNFTSDVNTANSLSDLDISEHDHSNWPAGLVWPQGLSMPGGDILAPFEPMPDFDPFDHTNMMVPELPELSNIFDPELIALPLTSGPNNDFSYLAMSPVANLDGDGYGEKKAGELAERTEVGYSAKVNPEVQPARFPASSTLPKGAVAPSIPRQTARASASASAHSRSSTGERAVSLRKPSMHRQSGPPVAPRTAGFLRSESVLSASREAYSGRPGGNLKRWRSENPEPQRRGLKRAHGDHFGSRSGKLSSLLLSSTSISANSGDSSRTSPSQCIGQCYASLIEQLSELTTYWSSQETIPLDKLLALDRDIQQQREKVLQCPSCMRGDRNCSQAQTKTLMFVIMVIENLLGLFEKECSLHQSATSTSGGTSASEEFDDSLEDIEETTDHRDEDEGFDEDDEDTANSSMSSSLLYTVLRQRRQNVKRPGSRRRRGHLSQLSEPVDFGQTTRNDGNRLHRQARSRSSSNGSSTKLLSTSRCSTIPPLSSLPQTDEPLLVGVYEVDDGVRTSFSRYLLQLHFQRQLDAIQELDRILLETQEQKGGNGSGAAASDVSHRIACETLADVHRRVEYFLGFIAFVG
ncbi:hypothetical protein A1O1_04520 [Capronia coronata CBS 617.96]|uniref:Uncharacterized protein n=1 Tax=Capronia coronata CBS 617.96 TaxID=1182541 RepID=W9YFW5_9EURO|nr:uncharacterized protein A1O1_04520 [Capronia coronata CBS 617.96]EXJ91408.1 hypothetical protein A1O1_04520 [Capronia coronata CBS 617.96]